MIGADRAKRIEKQSLNILPMMSLRFCCEMKNSFTIF